MRGDKLIINENHKKSAKMIADVVVPEIKNCETKYAITIAGESGSGKSETAQTLKDELAKYDIKTYIFQQDDYFVYPPKTNAKKRKENIEHVGTSEVKINLLDKHLLSFINGDKKLTKPLVDFNKDEVLSETVNLSEYKVAIAEGTYTTALDNAHTRIFIDRNYFDTKKSRAERSREKQDQFLEKILTIEHEIIRKQRERAHLIITKDYELKNLKSHE